MSFSGCGEHRKQVPSTEECRKGRLFIFSPHHHFPLVGKQASQHVVPKLPGSTQTSDDKPDSRRERGQWKTRKWRWVVQARVMRKVDAAGSASWVNGRPQKNASGAYGMVKIAMGPNLGRKAPAECERKMICHPLLFPGHPTARQSMLAD